MKTAEDYIDANLSALQMQVFGIYFSLNVHVHTPDSFFAEITRPALELWKTDDVSLSIREDILCPPVDPIVAQLRITQLFVMHAHAVRKDGNPEYSVAWAMEAHYQFGVLEKTVNDRIAAIAKARGAYKGKHGKFGKLWERALELARERAWTSKAHAARDIAKILKDEKDKLGGQFLTTGNPQARVSRWLTELLPPLEHDQLFPTAKAARQGRVVTTNDGQTRVRRFVPRLLLQGEDRNMETPALRLVRWDLRQAYAAWAPEVEGQTP